MKAPKLTKAKNQLGQVKMSKQADNKPVRKVRQACQLKGSMTKTPIRRHYAS